ncbi:MAG: hypothetical protein RL266_2583 [Bacteroidota bacterium]|jgi:endonuclease/exonuclease/phosphatase family metal-dependent hydrolase
MQWNPSFKTVILLCVLCLNACTEDPLTEFPELTADHEGDVADFRMTTYNIHGGNGPNGEGDFGSNLTAFHELTMGELILCMQEVEPDDWNELRSIFAEYPHRFYLPQCSTKFGTNKQGGNAILSKLPIIQYDHALINTDPGGDKWERKAQYLKFYVGHGATHLNLFHYHNTYNWHHNGSEAERQGFERFADWVLSKEIPSNEMLIITGDFNLSKAQCDAILLNRFTHYTGNWVDHIYGNSPLLDQGIYNTVGLMLSDHQAVWAVVCNDGC